VTEAATAAPAVTPIGELQWRSHARISGRVQSVRVQPWADVATLECLVLDESGGVLLVFLGRRAIPGVTLGRHLEAEGTVGESRGYLAIMNPAIELLSH
jgi:hypothetical protein